MSLGVLLLLVAGSVGWSAWRDRSAIPIDDQLPFLLDQAAETEHAEPDPAPTDASPEAPQIDTPHIDTRHVDTPPIDTEPAAAPLATDASVSSADREQEPAIGQPVVVHVSGAVRSPGVVELRGGSRVHHAVGAAGGSTAAADLDRVNLAAPLVDGERIHVPEIGDDAPPVVVAPERRPGVDLPTPAIDLPVTVDINRASVAELEALPGVGPSIARAILDLRTARGAYDSVDELLLVDGIGPAKLEALRAHAFVAGG